MKKFLILLIPFVIMGCDDENIDVERQKALDENAILLTQTNIKSLADDLDLYKLDTGSYPTTEQGLLVLKNVKTVPTDPFDNEYVYKNPCKFCKTKKPFDLFSKGRDGKEGTEDDIVVQFND